MYDNYPTPNFDEVVWDGNYSFYINGWPGYIRPKFHRWMDRSLRPCAYGDLEYPRNEIEKYKTYCRFLLLQGVPPCVLEEFVDDARYEYKMALRKYTRAKRISRIERVYASVFCE